MPRNVMHKQCSFGKATISFQKWKFFSERRKAITALSLLDGLPTNTKCLQNIDISSCFYWCPVVLTASGPLDQPFRCELLFPELVAGEWMLTTVHARSNQFFHIIPWSEENSEGFWSSAWSNKRPKVMREFSLFLFFPVLRCFLGFLTAQDPRNQCIPVGTTSRLKM